MGNSDPRQHHSYLHRSHIRSYIVVVGKLNVLKQSTLTVAGRTKGEAPSPM